MRTQKTISLFTLVIRAVIVTGLFSIPAAGQTPAPSPEHKKTIVTTAVRPVIVENKPAAPQVVTILHSLNGLKVFRLLLRSQEQVEAIAKLDEAFKIAGEVHTNVIAGLSLDDGHTIVAWLPEAEAEMPLPPMAFAPRTPVPPPTSATAPVVVEPPPTGVAPVAIPGVPGIKFQGNLLEPADLRVITGDGKRIMGHYVGLDGLTGLSLITLSDGSLPKSVDSKDETITVGQMLRVIGPQPAPRSEMGARTPMYVRIGETEATVVYVVRSPSGGVARAKIKSLKLSPANIGGVAINNAGETLGIVDNVEGNEATIVPIALVRMAAKRVMARQASVPRPWLGIRGEPVGSVSLEKIMRVGWELERARALAEKQQGIFLTSVAPGSPAELAKLKPGDVILSVNNDFVRNADDFSWLLDEAEPQIPVLFTVARPGKEASEALEITLSESPDPMFGRRRAFEKYIEKAFKPGSLLAEGIETIAIKPRVAVRLGSTGGLLVVSVRPSTNAFKAGLRPGDVIESIDGEPVSTSDTAITPKAPGVNSTCVVVRNKQKLVLTFQYSTNRYQKKPAE
jgi:S1-C subfamily serine protease